MLEPKLSKILSEGDVDLFGVDADDDWGGWHPAPGEWIFHSTDQQPFGHNRQAHHDGNPGVVLRRDVSRTGEDTGHCLVWFGDQLMAGNEVACWVMPDEYLEPHDAFEFVGNSWASRSFWPIMTWVRHDKTIGLVLPCDHQPPTLIPGVPVIWDGMVSNHKPLLYECDMKLWHRFTPTVKWLH